MINSSIQQPTFEISSQIQTQSWTDSRGYASRWAQWNSYINQVCLQTFLSWIQLEFELEPKLLFQDWAHRNGSAITLGQKRLILVPSLTIDMSEIEVPQLWVDDPTFAGDYYVALQVEPEDQLVKFWGYTTHRNLKAIAEYNSSDLCYFLAMENLILDINVFTVVQHLCPNEPTRFVA